MYEVYAERSPNVYKVTICLEELGATWRDTWVEVSRGVQHEPWFHELNPNGRIPVLVDQALPTVATRSSSGNPATSCSIWPKKPAGSCRRTGAHATTC